MKQKHVKPCRECPFRRVAIPGYLGEDTPEGFLDTTMADHAMPCHMTIDYTKLDWKEKQYNKAAYCAGSLNFFANLSKLSRDRERPRGSKDPTVFSSPAEFLAHHKNPPAAIEAIESVSSEAVDAAEEMMQKIGRHRVASPSVPLAVSIEYYELIREYCDDTIACLKAELDDS